MQLLDAIIAFALTMAALATVVTVIMEAGLRIARMRKKNFVEVMKLLNNELDKGVLNMTPGERWDFFARVVKNPAEAAAGVLAKNSDALLAGLNDDDKKNALIAQEIASLGRDISAGPFTIKRLRDYLALLFCNGDSNKTDGAVSGEPSPGPAKQKVENKDARGLFAFLRRDISQTTIDLIRLFQFFKQLLGGDKKRAALYEGVSLEYMLRCLAETPSIKRASLSAGSALKVEFNRLAKKYEEFGSSVSASFKHHARSWSIGIGIVLALAANVDGLRIFEAYLADSNLATAVIEKQDQLLKTYTEAEASREQVEAAGEQYEKAVAALAKARADNQEKAEIDAAKAALEKAAKKLEEISDISKIKENIQDAQKHVVDLVSMGVPIGWRYYPNCPYGEKSSVWDQKYPKCKSVPKTERNFNTQRIYLRFMQTVSFDWQGAVLWFFTVVISGVLIGLGAPFWFDIAKRLSQVRKGLQSAAASTEYRLSAKNANGDPKERTKIVENVLEQAAGEEALKEAAELKAEAERKKTEGAWKWIPRR